MRACLLMDDDNATDEVLESCRRGDVEAFRLLFETYQNRVYSIALVFFKGDAAAANDITQQVFLMLMTRVGQFVNRADFSTWLYRLATHACLDWHRSVSRCVCTVSSADTESVVPLKVTKTVEDEYADIEISRVVQTAIQELRPRFRIAILLKYFDDLSYEEMADALQVS